MLNNKTKCIIFGLIIIALIILLLNNIYNEKYKIKENFYAVIDDKIDNVSDRIDDLNIAQDLTKSKLNKAERDLDKTGKDITDTKKQLENDIGLIKKNNKLITTGANFIVKNEASIENTKKKLTICKLVY